MPVRDAEDTVIFNLCDRVGSSRNSIAQDCPIVEARYGDQYAIYRCGRKGCRNSCSARRNERYVPHHSVSLRWQSTQVDQKIDRLRGRKFLPSQLCNREKGPQVG